jgi:hypothetical protein
MKKTYLLQIGLTALSAIILLMSSFNNELLIFANLSLTTTLLVISYNYMVDKNTKKAYLFMAFGMALAMLVILELFGVI